MSLTIADWHQRYKQQASWTGELRRHLYDFPWFSNANKIIELGCGTGAILHELIPSHDKLLVGLDIDHEALDFASCLEDVPNYIQSDAHFTPFHESSFDVCLCHYLLLWVKIPALIFSEMVRITKPDGWILILAEPDYGSRIDFPSELEGLGKLQIQSLIKQGANPNTGRLLKSLFSHPNISEGICGIFGAQWVLNEKSDPAIEWDVLHADLDILDNSQLPDEGQIQTLQNADRLAWENETRVLFIPTFYGWGKVNKP